MEPPMLALTDIVAAFRRSQMRRAAIRDLQSLSREQLSDIGIPPDRFGAVIDGMLARRSRSTGARVSLRRSMRRSQASAGSEAERLFYDDLVAGLLPIDHPAGEIRYP